MGTEEKDDYTWRLDYLHIGRSASRENLQCVCVYIDGSIEYIYKRQTKIDGKQKVLPPASLKGGTYNKNPRSGAHTYKSFPPARPTTTRGTVQRGTVRILLPLELLHI